MDNTPALNEGQHCPECDIEFVSVQQSCLHKYGQYRVVYFSESARYGICAYAYRKADNRPLTLVFSLNKSIKLDEARIEALLLLK